MPPKAMPAAVFQWLTAMLGAPPPVTTSRRTSSSASAASETEHYIATGPCGGPQTILTYGTKHRGKTYGEIEASDRDYLQWTLQHCRETSSAALTDFTGFIQQKYCLRGNNKLEKLAKSSARSGTTPKASPTPKRRSAPSTLTYEEQLDAAMAILLDADPEAISNLGRRLVAQDESYQSTGQPCPRVMAGARALELMYHHMMLTEDGFEEDETPEEGEQRF